VRFTTVALDFKRFSKKQLIEVQLVLINEGLGLISSKFVVIIKANFFKF